MSAYEAEYDAALERLIAANHDLGQRFEALGASVYYDPEDDWFIISIGEPAESMTLDIDAVLSVRLAPDSWKILGFEMPSLTTFVATHPVAGQDLLPLEEVAARAPGTYVVVPRADVPSVAKDLRELMLA
jgi:hypothetical protein